MPAGIQSAQLTLQQYASQSNEPMIQDVAMSLLEVNSILNDIPFTTANTLKVNGARVVGNLPSVNWRTLNADSVAASSNASPFSEQAYVLSNVIDIDRLVMMDRNAIGNPAALQVNNYLKAVSYDITDKFFNNNQSSGNANAFVGIRQRLDDTTSWGTNAACKIDAGGVDLSNSGISQANANTFYRYLEQMLDEIGSPDGSNVTIYMNRDLARRATAAIRLLGAGAGWQTTTDAFGRSIEAFRNAVVRRIGLKADQSTEILTSTETSAGANGSSNYTSMYAVKWGENSFTGWQMEPIKVQALGVRTETPTSVRVFVEWAIGLYQVYTRGVARVYDIKVS